MACSTAVVRVERSIGLLGGAAMLTKVPFAVEGRRFAVAHCVGRLAANDQTSKRSFIELKNFFNKLLEPSNKFPSEARRARKNLSADLPTIILDLCKTSFDTGARVCFEGALNLIFTGYIANFR